MKPFLTANWIHLINITYAVPPALLLPYLPAGTSLDIIDGYAFVSLVPFDFTDCRLGRIKIPFHTDFPEINLRFYVNYEGRRGVVFIKEFVSKFFIGTIANLFYYEHYKIAALTSATSNAGDTITVRHVLKNKRKNSVKVTAGKKTFIPLKNTPEHFFEERYLGFCTDRQKQTLLFRVEHTPWELYPVKEYSIDFDFVSLLGKKWRFMNTQRPYLVMLIKGSAVKMFPHRVLEIKNNSHFTTELLREAIPVNKSL